jgi:hypothetical protein
LGEAADAGNSGERGKQLHGLEVEAGPRAAGQKLREDIDHFAVRGGERAETHKTEEHFAERTPRGECEAECEQKTKHVEHFYHHEPFHEAVDRPAENERQWNEGKAAEDEEKKLAYVEDPKRPVVKRDFYFNEAIGTFSTVASQEWYSSTDAAWIASAIGIDSLRVTISSRPYVLTKRTMAELEAISDGGATTGDPTDWCYYREQIRLYPTPQSVLTMTGAYLEQFTTLTQGPDTNAWMVEGEELIRTRAKIIMWEEVIRGDAGKKEGEFLRGLERDYLARLISETNRRSAAGQVVAYCF